MAQGGVIKGNKKGFTLIELVVVVLIIGILASTGIGYYTKTVENTKAQDALATGHMLATAHRIYLLDTPGSPLTGTIDENCGTACASAQNACRLQACGYIAQQNWKNSSYTYSAGGTMATLAVVARKTGKNPGTDRAPYSKWGYQFDSSGGCLKLNEAPDCPSF